MWSMQQKCGGQEGVVWWSGGCSRVVRGVVGWSGGCSACRKPVQIEWEGDCWGQAIHTEAGVAVQGDLQ